MIEAPKPEAIDAAIRREIHLNVETALKLDRTKEQRTLLAENSVKYIMGLIEMKYEAPDQPSTADSQPTA